MKNFKESIDKFCKEFTRVMESLKTPAMVLPSYLLLCSALQRPGESPMDITSRIIKKAAAVGIHTGLNADGSPNLINALIYIGVKEMIHSRKFEGATFSVIPKGSLQILSTFSGPGGSGTGYGVNITDTVIGGTSV